jgi:DNA (cytosine-5)-methyltransferase 1
LAVLTHEFTHLDLFSGIGGFAIGFQNAGFRTIAFAETDPDASLVLRHHWPDVPNLGDVKLITKKSLLSLGASHACPLVVTGGVPCQPASALGHMRGAADDRWLWPEAIRVVGELRPAYAVFENPPSVLVLPGFHRVIGAITALGYDLWWDVIPAAALGAGHLRERVLFFLADADRTRLERHAWHGTRNRRPKPRRSITTPNLRARTCTTRHWYETQSPVHALVDGLPARLVESALRCVGNAIVPELAQMIAETIITEET